MRKMILLIGGTDMDQDRFSYIIDYVDKKKYKIRKIIYDTKLTLDEMLKMTKDIIRKNKFEIIFAHSMGTTILSILLRQNCSLLRKEKRIKIILSSPFISSDQSFLIKVGSYVPENLLKIMYLPRLARFPSFTLLSGYKQYILNFIIPSQYSLETLYQPFEALKYLESLDGEISHFVHIMSPCNDNLAPFTFENVGKIYKNYRVWFTDGKHEPFYDNEKVMNSFFYTFGNILESEDVM
jgi:hypothetical protein